MASSSTEVAEGIEATVMGLREYLMQYFKNSCVEWLMEGDKISLYAVEPSLRGLPNYERVAIRNRKLHWLYLGNAPLLSVEHLPDTVVFNTGVLNRSPELRAVKKQLKAFLNTYLPGVKIKEHRGSVLRG